MAANKPGFSIDITQPPPMESVVQPPPCRHVWMFLRQYRRNHGGAEHMGCFDLFYCRHCLERREVRSEEHYE